MESIASSNANGVSVTLTWDELNRLSTVIDNRLPSGANTAVYAYDSAGNVVTSTYPNGFQTTFTYDQLSRMTALSTPVSSYSYQLGPTGNRTSATEGNGRALTWNYDGIYRLTGETITDDPNKNNGGVTYSLDPVGNRLSAASTLTGINSGSWTYNADDEISSETYDANGNVLSAGGVVYAYDSENHMTSMTGNGKVVTMVYDAFGNRVSKTVNGVTTKYLVEDDVNPAGLPQVLEEVQNGSAVRTYTYGLQRISESQFISNVWTTSFYGYDGAGSVRQLTDSTGKVTDEYEYDAFGNSFTKSGTTPNSYLYRGEQFDSDLGPYYLRARYYNPTTGRFLSEDPLGFAGSGPNLYAYAFDSPHNYIDPFGLTTTVIVWNPVGYGESSQGHVSMIINNESYSFGPNGMDVEPADQYLARNTAFRNGFGDNLNLTPDQESWLANFLKNYKGKYHTLGRNCTSPIREGLKDLGFDLPTPDHPLAPFPPLFWIPSDVQWSLENTPGLVTGWTGYSKH